LNLSIAASTLVIYAANQLILKRLFGNIIVQGYLNDVLASPLLLAYTNALLIMSRRREFVIRSMLGASLLVIPAAAYWEFVAPLYKKSVSDAYDFLAYVIGAVVYIRTARALGGRPR
jgi:hypothetical protein